MNYKQLTDAYYAHWLGQEQIPKLRAGEIRFIYSSERNRTQYGYNTAFEIWGLWFEDRGIISYGDNAKKYIEALKTANTSSLETLCNMLQKKSGHPVNLGIKYLYKGSERKSTKARVLYEKDYLKFAQFFSPNENCDDWLKDYFQEMVYKKQCCGVFEDGLLVSCTDAPGMPYMANAVQEIGINTLKEYRGKGFATEACLLAVEQCISQEYCPMWSTSSSNFASQKLAVAVGFKKYADCIMISES